MWIKICANTNLHDAQLAAELGADAVGFVFAPSKRQVTAQQVAAIAPHLPDTVEKVGVFATGGASDPAARATEIAVAIRAAGLTAAQLHGRPDAALIDALTDELEGRTRLIQVVSIEASPADAATAQRDAAAALQLALAQPGLWAILLDAAQSGASGGLGITFDWPHAAALARQAYAVAQTGNDEPPKLLIAGGLRAGNVQEAIAAFQPYGVDVASGVEATPGLKDPIKLRAFIDAARGSREP
jgi:phosphoribosylanthranilate isomerase